MNIDEIDSQGVPIGTNFQTDTTDDRGDFSLTLQYSGLLQLNATGYFYDEIGGAVSASTLTLNGIASVSGGGSQNAFINAVSHLEYARVTALLAQGADFSSALAEADAELFATLGVGGTSINPGAAGYQMNELGANTTANAYALATGSVFMEAAYLDLAKHGDAGSLGGYLTTLLDTAASEFADGGIDPGILSLVSQSQSSIEPDVIMASINSYYGGAVPIPNINLALDTDGDDVVNAVDTCLLQPNPDQSVVPPGLCAFQRSSLPAPDAGAGSGSATGGTGGGSGFGPPGYVLTGDLSGRGNHDYVDVWFPVSMGFPSFAAYLGSDGGSSVAPVVSTYPPFFGLSPGGESQIQAWTVELADVDGDGLADLLVVAHGALPDGGGARFQTQDLGYLPGDGQGHFGAPRLLSSGVNFFQEFSESRNPCTSGSGSGTGGVGIGSGSLYCAFDQGNTCVDPTSDPSNCGGCYQACPSGAECLNGTCMIDGTPVPSTSVLSVSALAWASGHAGTQLVALSDDASVPASALLITQALLPDGGLGPQAFVTYDNSTVPICQDGCPMFCTPSDSGYCPAGCPSSCTPPSSDAGYCPVGCPTSCVDAFPDAGYCPSGCASSCTPVPDGGFCSLYPGLDAGSARYPYCPPACVYPDAGTCPDYSGGSESQCPAICLPYDTTPDYYCATDCPGPQATCLPWPDGGPAPTNICARNCGPAIGEGPCSPGCYCPQDCPSPSTCQPFPGYCISSVPYPDSCVCPATCPTDGCIVSGMQLCSPDTDPEVLPCICSQGCSESCTPIPVNGYCRGGDGGVSQACACGPGCPTSCTSVPSNACPADCPTSCTAVPSGLCPPGCPDSCTPAPAGACPAGCSEACYEPGYSTNRIPTTGLALGDFNEDGQPDVAVSVGNFGYPTTGPSSETPPILGGIWIAIADGDGGYLTHGVSSITEQVAGVVVADFDGDGHLDIAAYDQCGVTSGSQSEWLLYVVYGDGTGNFTNPLTISVAATPQPGGSPGLCSGPGGPQSLLGIDVDGDGRADLVAGSFVLGSLGRSFGPPMPIVGLQPPAVATDFSYDGRADLLDSAGNLILLNPPGYQSW